MPINKIQSLAAGKSSWFKNPFRHARRVYINFLQYMFAPGDFMDLGFSFDPKITKIHIVEGGKVTKDLAGPKPVISVASDSGRQVMRTQGSIAERTLNGEVRFKEQMAFTLIANVVSNDEGESEDIAWHVGRQTFLYYEFLKHEGFFSIGHDIAWMPAQDATSVIEGDISGYFVSRVILPCIVLVVATTSKVNYDMWNRLYVQFMDTETEEEAYTILIEKGGT